nr:unnamed protein product [Callosobruchus chinensis]
MLDMVKPRTPGKISLSDLKKCKMTSIFFDTFFNLEKYLDHEQRDPFASQRDHDIDGQEVSQLSCITENVIIFRIFIFRKIIYLNSCPNDV